MNSIHYFSILKFITALISLPLLIFNKNLVYILLALNISEASLFSFYKNFTLNGLVGLFLIYWSLILPKYQDFFIITYILWNIYFSNKVLDNNKNNSGIVTSSAINIIPLFVYIFMNKDKLWYFSISRLILILFYSLHLIDKKS